MSGQGPKNFVIFASGVGTNAEVVLSHAKKNPDLLQPLGLLADRESIGALDLARAYPLPAVVAKTEKELLNQLQDWKPKWAFLLGYKKILTPTILDFFYDTDLNLHRILNVHPSLLPAYPGLGGYKKAFSDGVRVTGVTIHFVDSGLDTGIPLLQESFKRDENDTFESFVERAKEIEHRLVSQALEIVSRNQFIPSKSLHDRFIHWEKLP